MERKRECFSLGLEHKNAILNLSIKERGILITLIFDYVYKGSIDEFEKIPRSVKIIFDVIRIQLDRQFEAKNKK